MPNKDERTWVHNALELNPDTGEMRLFGIRTVLVDPLTCCQRVDELLGSGGEIIIHFIWFEQGLQVFDKIAKDNPNRTRDEILKKIVDTQPLSGLGITTLTITHQNPLTARIVVKNPPFKTVRGSAKRLISSFWEGVLYGYSDQKVTSRNFRYDKERDEFRFTIITIPTAKLPY